jgi:hypothetical protein
MSGSRARLRWGVLQHTVATIGIRMMYAPAPLTTLQCSPCASSSTGKAAAPAILTAGAHQRAGIAPVVGQPSHISCAVFALYRRSLHPTTAHIRISRKRPEILYAARAKSLEEEIIPIFTVPLSQHRNDAELTVAQSRIASSRVAARLQPSHSRSQ